MPKRFDLEWWRWQIRSPNCLNNSQITDLIISPIDIHNQKLVANVHPPDWINPPPAPIYDLVVIGAGTAAGLGAKVALVEKHLMGGDCLNVGCVPSKCLIAAARAYAAVARAKEFGIRVPEGTVVDFPLVMERMRQIRANLSRHDSASRFQGLGVDVFLGEGGFVSREAVTVAGKTLSFKKAVIATGARAAKPEILGLEAVGYLTNETVFSLTECPRRLAVIGGGPIGCELAQAFRHLGAEVVLFHKNAHILDREDPEAAEIVQQALIGDRIQLILSAQISQVEWQDGAKIIHYEANGQTGKIAVDEILVGTGRSPNVTNLNLAAAGVEYDLQQGVLIDDYLQTTNPQIYAAGDVCMAWKFTHAADAAARIVIKNTLFSPFGLGKQKLSSLIMPWVTYTQPEIAHVGMSAAEAETQGIAVNTINIPMSSVDRAIADGETTGFAKILLKKGTDKILGATIVSSSAGDLISEITLAMGNNLGLGKIASVIHPYPTQAEVIKKAADAYRRTLLTSSSKKFLEVIMKFP